jgi:outer membrane cobalamin receptor
MRPVLIFVLLVSTLALNGNQFKGVIKGRITDKATKEPLAGAYVIFGRQHGTMSDSDGNYQVTADQPKLEITFQLIGYESVKKEVELTSSETLELNVEMEMRVSEIGQVVVSANKTEQKVAELTVSMDVVKSSFLNQNHITDAADIMNRTPGIEVLDGQASVRGGSGFSYGAGSRVLALIDGLPMISADAGNIKWQFLPLENISQIEIIKGASSVLYGSSALNGVINFRTADASNIPETRFYAEAGSFGRPRDRNRIWWDSPRVFSSASFSHLRKIGNTDFGISGSLLLDEGYRKLNDEQLGRISLKIKHFSKKHEGLNYGINLHTGYDAKKDFILWEDADSGALKQSPSSAREFHGIFIAADPFIGLKRNNRTSHDLRMRLQTTLNRLPESSQNNSDASSIYTEYQFRHKLSSKVSVTAGASQNYSSVVSNFFGNHHIMNIAGYAQFELKPLNRLEAVGGIRVESFRLDGKNDRTIPIFRAGLNWQAADFTFLRASFGQGYRYPSLAEKFASTTLGSVTIIPNPDIRSESGWSTELGVKQGVGLGSLTGQADLSFFFLQNSNMIEYMFGLYPEGLGFRATNIEQSRIYGTEIEFSFSGSIGRVRNTITGGYTFMYPVGYNPQTHRNTGIYLKYRRKHSGTITLNSQWQKFSADITLFVRSKILNIDEVFLTTQILPGFSEYWANDNKTYEVLDAVAGYKLNSSLTISFQVKNLTNTEYMGRPGDIQPQRNYSLRLSGNF